MKKVSCLLLAFLMVLSLAACGSDTPSGEDTGKVIELKLGTDCSDPALSPEFNGYGHMIAKFCELVEEKTNGQVVITPYYESVLGGQAELFTQVRDGELDIFYGNALSTYDARFAFKGLPFLMKDVDQVHRLMASPEGALYQLYSGILAEYDIHLLGQGVGTFRGLANRKHKVATIADMSDITMRIYEDQTVKAFYSPICNASVISFNEAYTAIQTKTCDAIELAANVIIQSKFYEVCGYYTDLNWQLMSQGFMMSDKAFTGMSDELRQIVIDCSWEAAEYEYGIQVSDAAEALDSLSELGTEVYQLTDAERQEWIEYAQSLKDDYRGYIGDETYDEIMQIVADDTAANG